MVGTNTTESYPATNNSDFNEGNKIGQVLSVLIGATETAVGDAMIGGGGASLIVSGGSTAPVSVPAALVGAGLAGHGMTTAAKGYANLMTGKGQKQEKTVPTEEKLKNLNEAANKNIPPSQLGPSGKPKIYTVDKPNLKQAKDAARNNPKSNTTPVKHSSDSGQPTHYHSTKNGKKLAGKDNVHYNDKSSKTNPSR